MVREEERARWNQDLQGVVCGLPLPSTPHLERAVTEQMLHRQIVNIQGILQHAHHASHVDTGLDMMPLGFRFGTQHALCNARQAAGKAAALAAFLEQKTTVRSGRAPEQYVRDRLAAMPFLGSPSNALPRCLRSSIGTGHFHCGARRPSPVHELRNTAHIANALHSSATRRAGEHCARQLSKHHSHATVLRPPSSPQNLDSRRL